MSAAPRQALARAEALALDDTSNPVGVARQLGELPAGLERETEQRLQQAEIHLDLVEASLLAGILAFKHSPEDAFVLAELQNYTSDLKPKDAPRLLFELAGDPRYACLLGGSPLGRSLASRFGVDETALTQRALAGLAEGGTDDQVRKS